MASVSSRQLAVQFTTTLLRHAVCSQNHRQTRTITPRQSTIPNRDPALEYLKTHVLCTE